MRWLGDIPIIGWLFRSKSTQTVQKNLVIMIRPTILEDGDETGFEKNTLKKTKSLMVNSGRDLKKTTIGGPYSAKKVKENVKEFINERVIKPFEDDETDEKPAEDSPDVGRGDCPQSPTPAAEGEKAKA